MKQVKKTEKLPKRTKRISAALSRSIALILIIAVLVPVISYYLLPDWVYYLTAATRLFTAGTMISTDYERESAMDTIRDVEMNYDSSVEIYDTQGNLIYSTLAAQSGETVDPKNHKVLNMEYALDYEITEGEIKKDSWGYLIRNYDVRNVSVTFLEYYSYLPGGERIDICMQVSQTTTVSKIEVLITFIALMGFVAIALRIIISYMKKFAKPIKRMVRITGNMSRLDFSEKCPPVKYEELSQLSDSINDMSQSLDAALTELQERNLKLQKDIENERTIDELRQTFISGISHELKTPIAIIQGYAEGAKAFYAAGNTELADKYCDTIAEEALRMNNMILKLLEITRYESGAYEPAREIFDIREEVQDWIDRNESIIREKGVTVVNSIEPGTTVYADRFLIGSNINNYLSNAMSHVEGDMLITVSVQSVDENSIRLNVENTGRQIAEKDIDKIWTSFYRADKSLSRKQGRFGLGLATVASIQKLHGMAYGVENTEAGVKFSFDMQKADENNNANS